MKRHLLFSIILLLMVTDTWAGEPVDAFARLEPIELSGILRKPIKWNPRLELQPQGVATTFDLNGPLLRDIPEGTHIRVVGVVRSHLHTGGTQDNPSPFPAQWMVWLDVTEVEVLKDPMEMLKRKTAQQPLSPPVVQGQKDS